MSLEHILLGALREPATGYELGKELAESAGHYWPAERSQIYPTLRRLQQRGWLAVSDEPSERGPRRKVYATTDEGRAEIRRWLLSGPQIGRERLGYIAQIVMLGELDDFVAGLGVIRQMQARWKQTLSLFEFLETEGIAASGDWTGRPPDEFFRLAALRNGMYQMRAKLAWCDEMIERLEARSSAAAPVPVEENR